MSTKIVTTRDVLDARDAVHESRREWESARDRLDSESRLLAMTVDELVEQERLNVNFLDVSLVKWRAARDSERDAYAAHMQARGRWQRLEKEHAAQQMTMDEIVRRAVKDDR